MRKWWSILAVAIVMAACGGAEESATEDPVQEEQSKETQSKEERQAEIAQMEKEISMKLNDLDKAYAERIILRYRDYVGLNPRDSISAEYLFKAADLSIGIGKPEAAINFIDRLHTDFPDYRKAVEMWLFKGFIYETYLNNHAKAVETYKELIKRYPNHRLAADAQASINNLSMSEEELIDKFKEMNETAP